MMLKPKMLRLLRKVIRKAYPDISLIECDLSWDYIGNTYEDLDIGTHTKIYPPAHVFSSKIGDYTYVSMNARISMSTIGKFCSIGPNFLCGWGYHPLNGISTAPMFYSTLKQNGITLSSKDKVAERRRIVIGNDVFIGANVTVLDGVTIGDGAVIGAGAVVSKDIPPYAVAVGCPIRVVRYRFGENQIESLKRIKWWDFDKEKLQEVERFFFDVDGFIQHEEKKLGM